MNNETLVVVLKKRGLSRVYVVISAAIVFGNKDFEQELLGMRLGKLETYLERRGWNSLNTHATGNLLILGFWREIKEE